MAATNTTSSPVVTGSSDGKYTSSSSILGTRIDASALTSIHAPVAPSQVRRLKKEYPREDLPRRLSSVTKSSHKNNNNRSSSTQTQAQDASQSQKGVDYSFLEEEDSSQQEVTFFQDFVAGGIAGSASVIVGHPFDTIKVRVQSSTAGILSSFSEFGGFSSLFRGIGTPLASAAVINAVIFSSYGSASKLYDIYVPNNNNNNSTLISANVDSDSEESNGSTRDPLMKSTLCGAFAGFVQCTIICPMEHVKCRLQVQHGKGSADAVYSNSFQATHSILKEHGFGRLYQGWWATFWREIPAFALYFASYDMIKDNVNQYVFGKLLEDDSEVEQAQGKMQTKAWLSSAVAGGFAGAITWGVVYPVDVLKTRIQTASLTTPKSELKMWHIGRNLVQQHGWRYLFRGFGITLIRAFPVNATLFPIYEYTLLQMQSQSSFMSTSPSATDLGYNYYQQITNTPTQN